MKKQIIFKCFLLALLLAGTFAVSANAAEARQNVGARWEDESATVYFYCGFNSIWKNEISAAMNSWNNVLSLYDEIIVPMAFTSNSNHINKIYSTSGQTWLALAHWDKSNGYFTEMSIAFNSGSYTYTVGATSGKYDIQSIALHELGHAIGIAHCHEEEEASCFSQTCSTNVMQPTISDNCTRRNLASYDTSSKMAIYW